MIAGLEEIRAGTIAIVGKVVNGLAPKARDISMVFQNYALYPHMTVRENMAFSMTLAGAAKADKAARVLRAAEIPDLVPYLDRIPFASASTTCRMVPGPTGASPTRIGGPRPIPARSSVASSGRPAPRLPPGWAPG